MMRVLSSTLPFIVAIVAVACSSSEPAKKANGQVCAQAAECVSGFCRDGYCCNSACTGVCEQCDSAEALGVCRAVPAGQDPHQNCDAGPASTCGNMGGCNGARGCTLWPQGTICAQSTCTNDIFTPDMQCDGLGTCAAGNAATKCVPYGCTDSAGCNPTCVADGGAGVACASNSVCQTGAGVDGGNVCKGNTGVSCSVGAQCVSATCEDAGACS